MQVLQGKKTYIVVIIMLIYAVSGLFLGNLDTNSAIQIVLTALGVGGLRSAISGQ